MVVKIMVPFLDPYFNTAPHIQGTQKGTIIFTTTHMNIEPAPACGPPQIPCTQQAVSYESCPKAWDPN